MYKQFDNKSFDEAWEDTKRWNKNDLRQCDIILCPIHKSDHWSLISIDTKQKTVEYYDSIIGSRKTSNAPRIMKKFIEKYYNSRGEKQTFRIKICEDAPIQGNGVDCGIFVCQNAEKLARRAYVNTKQAEMAEARRRMMVELYYRKILSPGSVGPDSLATLIETDSRITAMPRSDETRRCLKKQRRAVGKQESRKTDRNKAAPRKVETQRSLPKKAK